LGSVLEVAELLGTHDLLHIFFLTLGELIGMEKTKGIYALQTTPIFSSLLSQAYPTPSRLVQTTHPSKPRNPLGSS